MVIAYIIAVLVGKNIDEFSCLIIDLLYFFNTKNTLPKRKTLMPPNVTVIAYIIAVFVGKT